MSKAGKAFLWLFILLILIPGLLILAAFLTAKYYPKSKAGVQVVNRYEMFKEMMERRRQRRQKQAEQNAVESLK